MGPQQEQRDIDDVFISEKHKEEVKFEEMTTDEKLNYIEKLLEGVERKKRDVSMEDEGLPLTDEVKEEISKDTMIKQNMIILLILNDVFTLQSEIIKDGLTKS